VTGLAAAGAALAEAREQQQLQIETVASALHLRPEVVTALESGDEARLPSRPFVRGYMKAYARLLGLDEENVLSRLPSASEHDSMPLKPIGIKRRSVALPLRTLVVWGGALAGLVIVVVFGMPVLERLWSGEMFRPASDQLAIPLPADDEAAASDPVAVTETDVAPVDDGSEPDDDEPEAEQSTIRMTTREPEPNVSPALPETEPEPPAEADAPPASEPQPAEQASDGPAVVLLRFSEDSWVEMEAHGRKLMVGTQRAGTERTVRVEPPVDLLLGNAPGVQVNFRGRPVNVKAHQRGNVARLTLED
jgi:cytoskeleton protein RodZ